MTSPLRVSLLVATVTVTLAFAATDSALAEAARCTPVGGGQYAAPDELTVLGASCPVAQRVSRACLASGGCTGIGNTIQVYAPQRWRCATRMLRRNGHPAGGRTTCVRGRSSVRFTYFSGD